jgi:hypothetical protein
MSGIPACHIGATKAGRQRAEQKTRKHYRRIPMSERPPHNRRVNWSGFFCFRPETFNHTHLYPSLPEQLPFSLNNGKLAKYFPPSPFHILLKSRFRHRRPYDWDDRLALQNP